MQEDARRVAMRFFEGQAGRGFDAIARRLQIDRVRLGVRPAPALEHTLTETSGGFGHANEYYRAAGVRNRACQMPMDAFYHSRPNGVMLPEHLAHE